VSWPSRLSSADAWAEHVAGPLVPNLNVRVSGATALVSPLFDPAANPFEQRTRQVSEIRWLGVATIERVRKRGREAPAETAATPPRPLAVAVLTESLRPAAALPATARAAATVAAKTSLEPTTRVYDAPRRPSLAPASLRARLDFVLPATLGSLESVSGGPTRRRTGRSRMTRSEERRVMAARVTSAGLLTLAMLVVTCVSFAAPTAGPPSTVKLPSGTFTLSSTIRNKVNGKQSLNFVLSIEGTGIPIFGPAMADGWKKGVSEVESKYGVKLHEQVIGPVNTDIPTQVSQINSLLKAGQVDCLAFEAHAPGPYVGVVNQAMKMGVPVFSVNADSPSSRRIAFFGPDEFAGGETAGKVVGQWAKKNHISLTTAALMTGSVEGPWAQNRMKGFIKGITSIIPSIKFVNSPTSGIESQGFTQATVYADAKAYLQGHPQVQLVFHTDQGVEMVAKAINDLHLKNKVYAAGYNIDPPIASYVKNGLVVVTMVQGFARQAEAGAKACGDFLYAGKYQTGHVVIPPEAVTQANVASKNWTNPANQ